MLKDFLKLISIYCLRILVKIFYIFPIKNNRIFFHSYLGTQYACNPKYLSEYIIENYSGKYEIIWAFKNKKNFEFLQDKEIKLVNYFSLSRLYYEATSRVSINNVGSFSWLPLRKNQIHINTWHGGGCYKKASIGEKANNIIMKKTILLTVKETSYFISSSRYFSEYVLPNDFAYTGNLLEYGMPRNDLLVMKIFHNKIVKKIREYYNLPQNTIIVLYAPTWKYNIGKEFEELDIGRLTIYIEKKFHKKCIVLYRSHHISKSKAKGIEIDVTDYPDMQELLVASDILISDYSSCIWDFSLLYRPCFLFTPDLEDYTENRGFDKDIYSWGFPVCTSNARLFETIEKFEEIDFINKMKCHHTDLGSYENGCSCKEICEVIL